MVTPGQFQVSESGAATYTIPIQVSPGVGGMEPKLSLNYSSQSGNGLLGVGWNLAGLGGITHCARTLAQDGVRGSVTYDGNDRYCLDGQRLIAINGSDGGDGTEYRTERESFAKIVSYGAAGSGPAWFKVWTKAGQVMEYGATVDSRMNVTGKNTVRMWALNRIEDTKNNYLAVSYLKEDGTGDFHPGHIDYSGNSKTGTSAKNSVWFQYETRPDVSVAFQAGSLVGSVARLTGIKNYEGQSLTRSYQLSYELSSTTKNSLLKNVTECDATNKCFPSAEMTTLGKAVELFAGSSQQLFGWQFGSPPQGNWQLVVGDFNGDGNTDFAYIGGAQGASTDIYVALSDGNGGFTAKYQNLFGWNFGAPVKDWWKVVAGDFDGDGKTDIAFIGGSPVTDIYLATSNGDGTFRGGMQPLSGWYFGFPITDYELIQGDFNGDGRTDIAFLAGSPGQAFVLLSRGDGTFSASYQNLFGWQFGSLKGDWWKVIAGDFDGDGKTDIAFIGGSPTTDIYLATSNGDGTFKGTYQHLSDWNFGFPITDYEVMQGDFNGDGKTDIVFLGGSPTAAFTLLSKGDGTFLPKYQTLFGWQFSTPIRDWWKVVVADFDGDGKDDIGFIGGVPNTDIYVASGNGDGTYRGNYQHLSNWAFGFPVKNFDVLLGDFNGDGKADISFVGDTPSTVYTALSQVKDNLVSEIGNGIGSKISISYAPLSKSNVYVKDTATSASVYPIVDVQAALYVVSSVSSSNGIGGAISTSYSYGGLKRDVDGRGSLGFRWLLARQVETSLTSYTEYLQTWPYTGLPSLVRKTISDGGNVGLLSVVDNSYGCIDPGGATASPCKVSTGKRYFVYANQSIEKSWDYNGAALPVITTKTEYDSWGNATKVNVSTSDGYGKTTINNYSNDTSNWYLGRLLKSSVSSVAP